MKTVWKLDPQSRRYKPLKNLAMGRAGPGRSRSDFSDKLGKNSLRSSVRSISYKTRWYKGGFSQFHSEKGSFETKKTSVDKSGLFYRQRELKSSEDSLSRYWTAPPSDGWPLSNRRRTPQTDRESPKPPIDFFRRWGGGEALRPMANLISVAVR